MIKMKIAIYKDYISVDGKDISTVDLYNENVENIITNNKDKYLLEDIDEINELFIKYAHESVALSGLFSGSHPDKIYSYNCDSKIQSIVKDVVGRRASFFKKIIVRIRFLFINIASLFFLLSKIIKRKTIVSNHLKYESFYVSRAKQDIKMIRALKEDDTVEKIYENFFNKVSYLSNFSRNELVSLLFVSFFKSFRRIKKIKNYVTNVYGENCAIDSLRFYSKRVLHTSFYEEIFNRFCSFFEGKTCYTGDNLDRFAIIQERVCRKFNCKLICIPHGIEYGFFLPHCFTGDIFYCTSQTAANYLNFFYREEKFVYSPDVCHKMFSVDNGNSDHKIVYFSEPREPFVNIKIVKSILEITKSPILLKLHPADSKDNYEEIQDQIEYCDDFNYAITNSVCVARKSTILVEAKYNKSSAIAVIINENDKMIFDTFPSLQDPFILKVFDLDSLQAEINKEMLK